MDVGELCKACENGEDSKVNEILAQGNVDVNGQDAQNFSPLHHAMAYNHSHIVRKLLSTPHLQLGLVDSAGWTGLHWASHWNNVNCIKLFITDIRCTDKVLNMKNNNGESALMFAVSWGNLESVKVLSAAPGIELNTRNNSGDSLDEVARQFNHQHVIMFLEKLSR